MKLSLVIRQAVACCVLLAGSMAAAQTPSPESPVPVDRHAAAHLWLRELWVPSEALGPVLGRYPRAVSLSHDELFTLLRDAQADSPASADATNPPPERAVLRQARFDGTLALGPDAIPFVRVEATLEVEALSNAWAEVPLGLPNIILGTAEVSDPVSLPPALPSGRASLRRSQNGPGHPASLLLQGRGVHRLRLGFLLPVTAGQAGSRIDLPQVAGISEFTLHLPAGTRADSPLGCLVQPDGAGTTVRVALHATVDAQGAPGSLRWRTNPLAMAELGSLLQAGRLDALVEQTGVTVRQDIEFRPALGKLPREVQFALPAGANAVRVEGDGLGRWDVGVDGLRVQLPEDTEGQGKMSAFSVFYTLPLGLDHAGDVARAAVPLLEAKGAHRVTGEIIVRRVHGVEVRRIDLGAVASPTAGSSATSQGAHATEQVANFLLADLPGADSPPAPPTALSVEARRVSARFSVDADARADFQPDGIHVQRKLAVLVEEGSVFTAKVILPFGETVLGVRSADKASVLPDWQQQSNEILLRWNTGLGETSRTTLDLESRADFSAPKADSPATFLLGAALVPGAERLTGYVALASAPAFRVSTTGGEDRLERRDGRATPLRGEVAWFYRDDFRLALRIERRTAQTDAQFTGYALPTSGAVEIHAQLAYRFLLSGVEAVKIRVPRELADAFSFTGKRIAERRLNGDVWTIRFQGEQTGEYFLGVQATIPAPADRDDAQHFHFRLPAVVPLETARWSGTWAVEANTDTEIRFATTGANETDALHAPTLSGYQPRHRIIGVFEFLGGAADASIELDGVRHPAAAVAGAVVDRLELETAVSTSGIARHWATLRARVAADGFFDLRLPRGASLWSLTLNGEPIKPVGHADLPGTVRVELPGGREPANASTVVAVYETPGRAWENAGWRSVAAPTFDAGVPVLESRWTLRLPDGFDYRFPDLDQQEATPDDLLIPQFAKAVGRVLSATFGSFHLLQSSAPYDVDTESDGPLLPAPSNTIDLPTVRPEDHNAKPGSARSVDESGTAAMNRKLQRIIIPHIEFRSTTISDAVEYLRQESVRLDTAENDQEARGVNIFLKLPAGGSAPRPVATAPVDPATAIPGLPPGADGSAVVAAPTATASTRISLSLIRIPLLEALRYVAQQASLKVKVEQYAVSLVPLNEITDVLITREFKVSPNVLNISEAAAKSATSNHFAEDFLKSSGVQFPAGASATYLRAARKLVVRNTQENIDLVESLIQDSANSLQSSQALSTPQPRMRKKDDSTAAIRQKLERIHIPHIEFRATTVNDAVEFLRQESVRLDNGPDPRGINIFLKLPSSSGSPANTRISLALGNIPLIDALRYVAQQAGLKVKVEPSAVSLVPLTESTDVLITQEYQISPDLVSGAMTTGGASGETTSTGTHDVTGVGSVMITRQDTESFLKASGIQFPAGASATYLPGSGKLIVRNTQENIDLVDALVDDSEPAKPSAPFRQLEGRESGKDVAGLLPLQLDLPPNGRVYEFAGGGAPGDRELRFTDWSTASRWHWIYLTMGAAGFLLLAAAWTHPWRRTFYAVLVLSFFPLIVAPSATQTCNALLAGWLWALAGWCLTRVLIRRRRLVPSLLVCAAALLPYSAMAAPTPSPTPTPYPGPELVIVPFDAGHSAASQTPKEYYLPYDRFLLLWDAAKRHRRPAAPEPPQSGERYALSTARYDAKLVGETLSVAADLDVQSFGEGWVGILLPFEQAYLGAITLDGEPAALTSDGKLWTARPGAHHVSITLNLPTGPITAGTRLSWNVPPAVAALVTLSLNRTDLRAEIRGSEPGGGEIEEITPGGRKLTASLGGTERVEVTFRDAPVPPPATAQAALASVRVELSASARQEEVRAALRYSFPGGSLDRFTVELDRSLTLTDLDAPDIRQWHLTTGGDRQTLEIALNTPARDGYQLTLTADRPIASLPATRRAFPLVSAQAARIEQTAVLATQGAVEFSLPDGPPANERRVEVSSQIQGQLFAAYAAVNGTTSIVYSLSAASVKRVAHINYLYQVGRGKIELAASLRLVPAAGSAPLLTADLKLPQGFMVQAVVGEAVQQWWREGDLLSLRFKSINGQREVPLLVYLIRQFDRPPEQFPLPPLTAIGFAETDGQTVVAADRSYKVGLQLPATARSQDLGEIAPDKAATEFQVKAPLERQRAFSYRGSEFIATVTLEVQPARWQAQWVTRATVHEGSVALETHVNVESRQGAVEAMEFSLAAELPEARVSGPDVRETVVTANKDRRSYRVLFQNPLYANVETGFTVNLEIPLGTAGRTALPALQWASDGGRPTGGFILVENASSGEMTLNPRGLDPAIEKDVPFLPEEIVAGTRFFRAAPGVPLSLDVQVSNLEKTAGRSALVAYAELTSTLRANGEEWHRATYRLQNRRLQFLPVELPADMEFIGARVAGESVRVDLAPGDQKRVLLLLVPLLKTRPGELSYDVELIYRRPATGSDGWRAGPASAHWQLHDPRLPGVPIEKTLWNVYLPEKAWLVNTGGNLEPVVAALTETEKLESSLSDLRTLSATYQSDSASQEDRQLALDNYTQLAEEVTKGANKDFSKPWAFAKDAKSLLKQPKAATQNALAKQQQQSILGTVNSLNAANLSSVQTQRRGPQGQIRINEAKGQAAVDADGFIQYGQPIERQSPLLGNIPLMGRLWRDNRVTVQKEKAELPLQGAKTNGAAKRTENRKQLALNDSVAVELPGNVRGDTAPEAASDKAKLSLALTQAESRLSTARVDVYAGAVALAPTAAPAIPASPAVAALPGAAVAVSTPAAVPVPDSPVAGIVRPKSLRSDGRISLAIDFPLEGRVYHFKKIKADAYLTLWSLQPASFARLAWLGILLVGVGLLWTLRRVLRRRTARGPGLMVS